MRSRISHIGVLAGVSSRGTSPSSSRIAGKGIRRGAGGVTRNSHQMIGSPANATSSHGETKARDPSASIRQCTVSPRYLSPSGPGGLGPSSPQRGSRYGAKRGGGESYRLLGLTAAGQRTAPHTRKA